jgi:hypothetical protein
MRQFGWSVGHPTYIRAPYIDEEVLFVRTSDFGAASFEVSGIAFSAITVRESPCLRAAVTNVGYPTEACCLGLYNFANSANE